MFDRAAASYAQVGPPFFSHFGKRLVDTLALAQGAIVLDVACGTGASLLPAAERVGAGGLAIGVDFAGAMLERALDDIGQRGISNAMVARMDATALAFPGCTFDAILCGFALNRFSPPVFALEEFYRVLRPQGQLGLIVSEGWWWEWDKRWQWHAALVQSLGIRVDYRPRRYPTADDISKALTEESFGHVSVIAEPYDLVFTDVDEWWRWCWSQGYREVMEGMVPSQLEEYRAACFKHLQERPVLGCLKVFIATGIKSSK